MSTGAPLFPTLPYTPKVDCWTPKIVYFITKRGSALETNYKLVVCCCMARKTSRVKITNLLIHEY